MSNDYTVTDQSGAFAVSKQGSPVSTPERRPMLLPTRALAEAVAFEFKQHGKFAAGKMPITTLAQTAIDRIDDQRELIVESLMVYVDTDALAYRAGEAGAVLDRQKRDWDPIIAWFEKRFGATWQTTSGVMPIDQTPELHKAVRAYLAALSTMKLAACCMLSATYSSVLLAVAVTEDYISAEGAFNTSRLEEDIQAEQWGRDPEAERRAQKIKEEIIAAGRFLDLLKAA